MHPVLGLLLAQSAPERFTAVPAISSCRIFNMALSQGACGSCAAFAVSTAVAMRLCLRDGTDFIPSPFRIFDCSGHTCEQGLTLAKAIAIAQYGVGDLQDSPPMYGLPCDLRWEKQPPIKFKPMAIKSTELIKAALLTFGPIPAAIKTPRLRHAVVLIGWDKHNWLIQNSWGEIDGEHRGRRRVPYDELEFAIDLDIAKHDNRAIMCIALACASFVIAFIAVATERGT
jgi:hypothetical protein